MTIYALLLWAALQPPPPTTYRGLEACERAGRIAAARARKAAPGWACVSLRGRS